MIDDKKAAEDKIRRGIIRLQKPQPFFAYLLMHLKPKMMSEEQVKTLGSMGVNMKGELIYNPEFVIGLSDAEMHGVLCHEVLHIALLQLQRIGGRYADISNIAMDIIVNMIVMKTAATMRKEIGYGQKTSKYGTENVKMALPKNVIPVDVRNNTSMVNLGATQLTVNDVTEKSWEAIYAEIIEHLKRNNIPPNGSGMRNSNNSFDSHMEGDGEGNPLSQKEQQELQGKWQGAVAEAAQYAKSQGKLPSGMERVIDEILKPKVQWKQMLMKYLRPHFSPVDWTYQRPHKKSQVLEVFMPRTLKERCEVEVIVDTSGSISQKELTEFLSEIVAIAKSMSHVKMWVTFYDTDMGNRYEVENGDIPKILSMKPSGRGGTDMEGALDEVKKMNREIPVVVVLTDGYTNFDRKRHEYPFDVIWVITKDGINDKVPYGQTVKME